MIDKADVNRPLLAAAAILGAIGVALAARASHAADTNLAIAASFLQLHAPVLLGISLIRLNTLAQVAGYVLIVSLLLFGGDLAMLSQTGTSVFPLAAPIGGAGMILGWLLLAASAIWGWRR